MSWSISELFSFHEVQFSDIRELLGFSDAFVHQMDK